MSTDVDSTIEEEPPSICSASGRSENGSSSPVSAGEKNGDRYGNLRDSGVVIPTPSSRSVDGQEQGLTAELRRQSMAETLTGVDVKDLSARELQLMYALHNRRGSFPSEEGVAQDGSRVQTSLSDISMQQLSPNASELNCSACCRQWNPRFHSQILERYWKVKAVEFLRRRYRVAVLFIALFAVLWVVFFSVSLPFDGDQNNRNRFSSDRLAIDSVRYSIHYIAGGLVVFAIALALLLLTFWRHYGKIATGLSITLALVLMIASILIAIGLNGNILLNNDALDMTSISTISYVTQFTISSIVVLVVYTLSRLPIWLAAMLCILYMFVLELTSGIPLIASGYSISEGQRKLFTHSFIARFFFHTCLNVVGFTTGYLSQVRLHDTFWRIAQCVLARKMIESERDVEEKTIHSMMPKLFAEELLSTEVQVAFMISQDLCVGREPIPSLHSVSAPFTVRRMNEVSILFADIVGFTQFSSNLSAVELVGILDDIFSTFDYLTQKHRCEKINTLGDCYFCVSGCPTEDDNHANNCVEMGLSIISSLAEYRATTGQPIQMRVGIHTGSVLCGVMGTKRFKFDVWSRDVTIASHIESVGIPGSVVISDSTLTYLSSGLYVTEEADISQVPPELNDVQLYKVVRRRDAPGPVPSWRQRIKSIDSQIKEERSSQRPLIRSCCGQTLRSRQPNNTLRDSLTRQSYLQHCASYTELADPNMGHQVIIDKRIVELMEEQQVSLDSYYDTEINLFTLSFDHRSLEQNYRNYGRGAENNGALKTELGYQLAKRSYLIDTISLFAIFILIMLATMINLTGGEAFSNGNLWQSWLVILLIGLLVEGSIVVLVVAVYFPNLFPRHFSTIAHFSINWNVRTIISLILIYYPMAMVTVSLTQCYGPVRVGLQEDFNHVQMAFYITIVVLICSISFMEVSYIVKLVGGIMSAVLTLVLVSAVHLHVCKVALNGNQSMTTPTPTTTSNSRNVSFEPDTYNTLLVNYYIRHIAPEAAILFLLVLILLLIVNRMSELSVRLSFIGRMQAAFRKQYARQQKNQVEWLLFNIIPPHVALELRTTSRYSRIHERVGVIFASIVNFGDFSCRQSNGDEQAFRLLNKIVREFDSLLDQPQFASVEKIKTIGSTYMAASGLSLAPHQPCPVEHLVALIDFSLQLGDVLRRVSILVPGFTFLLRVGFNYGPVTAGVVGSNKLLFDIWGDTVNVASRMDTMGQVFKIHMPEDCLELLRPYVTSDPTSHLVEIKGKGHMKTVFVTGRKNPSSSCMPCTDHHSQ